MSRKRTTAGLLKRGDTYHYDIHHGGKRHRGSLHTTDRGLAEKALAKIRNDIFNMEHFGAEPRPAVSLEEFAGEYLQRCRGRNAQSTITRKKDILRLFVGYLPEGIPLDEIGQETVEAYLSARASVTKPRTCNIHLTIIRHLFEQALERGLLETNPAAKIKPYKEPAGRVRYLETWEEIEGLLDTSPHTSGPSS